MELKRLLSLARQAIDEYGMIEDGDKIAIGISGGKDSLALLYALHELRRFYPKSFDIEAVSIDVGFNMDFEPVRKLCDELDVNYTVVNTQIKTIVFDERKEENPCSLCAKLRKGALNDQIKKLGCNKVAYAHHKDDVVNTFMMSLFYEGRIQTLEPVTFLEGADITLIRPLIFVKESEIIGFKNKYNLPVIKNKCPVDGYTKRQYIDDLLRAENKENKGVKDRIFTAVRNGIYKDFLKES